MQTQKNLFFAKNVLQISCFFQEKTSKNAEMVISTSVRSAQHPNAGRNIQHLCLCFKSKTPFTHLLVLSSTVFYLRYKSTERCSFYVTASQFTVLINHIERSFWVFFGLSIFIFFCKLFLFTKQTIYVDGYIFWL